MKCGEYLASYPPKVLEHVQQVESLCLMLFSQLDLPYDTKLLSLGALLHDISQDPKHNKAGAKMLLEGGLEGLDEDELLVVACLVRYHRGSCPKMTHKNFSKLNPRLQHMVKVFAGIIKLCDALDWKHQNFTRGVCINIKDKKAFLTLDLTSNIIIKSGFLKFFEKKKDLFERTFGVRVCILQR